MTEYYRTFIAMCKKVCGLKLDDDEGKFVKYYLLMISNRQCSPWYV